MSPELLKSALTSASICAKKLRLPLRSRVWKGQTGEFLGAGVGSSLDFQDHRAYVPGDDPRHINWQAYARTGQYSMKLYREEVRPIVDLVFDVSESMFFEPLKARRSCELFYFLTESAARSGASLRMHLLVGSNVSPIPMEAVNTHYWHEVAQSLRQGDPNAPANLATIPFRANAFRVFLSDLLFPGDPLALIGLLGQHQGSPVIFAPFTQAETDPEWHGNYEFIEAELHTRHPHRIEPSTLNRYKKAYSNHFDIWKSTSRRYNAALARVGADSDLESALHDDAVKAGALEVTN
ncbi:MAG: DUF58 domain-containing protein [Akkermansiaceae bacterium]